MIHSFRESRLLWRQGLAEASNEELLQAVTAEDNLSPREKLERKFNGTVDSATNRIKTTGAKWMTWIGSRLSNEDADQKAVDAAITKIAQEQAKTARSNIAGYMQGAERTLFDKSVNASNSLTILETKQRVCDEIIADLSEEIEAKQDLRRRYEEALGEVAKLKGRHTDTPALKKIETKLKSVQNVRAETDIKVAERLADKEIARTGRVHDQLKTFILNANPALGLMLDRMLLDNAAGENDNLLKAIDVLPFIDKTERAMLKDLAKHLRLGRLTWAKNRSIREFYQSRVSATETLNPEKLTDRLKLLYDQAPIGQSVFVATDNGVNMSLGVIRKEVKDGSKKVVLVNKQGKQVAVIDTGNKVLTVMGGVGGKEFTHYAIDDEALKGKQFDPTQIRFKATRKEVIRTERKAA